MKTGSEAAGKQDPAGRVGHHVEHPVGPVDRRRPATHVEHAVAGRTLKQVLQARGQHGQADGAKVGGRVTARVQWRSDRGTAPERSMWPWLISCSTT